MGLRTPSPAEAVRSGEAVRKKHLTVVLALLGVLAMVSPAAAAIFIRLTTTAVPRGGVVRFVGDAAHMPLYALPASRMPCARYGTCPPVIHRAAPPRRPFVFLGEIPAASGPRPTRSFRIRLPRSLRPGRYKVFVWCAECGGSLIVAGTDSSGQTLHVLP
jgi:hypothetical protein